MFLNYYDKGIDKLWIGTMSNGLFSYDFDRNFFGYSSVFSKQPVLAIK